MNQLFYSLHMGYESSAVTTITQMAAAAWKNAALAGAEAHQWPPVVVD